MHVPALVLKDFVNRIIQFHVKKSYFIKLIIEFKLNAPFNLYLLLILYHY